MIFSFGIQNIISPSSVVDQIKVDYSNLINIAYMLMKVLETLVMQSKLSEELHYRESTLRLGSRSDTIFHHTFRIHHKKDSYLYLLK